ncbi:hypothetical protein [Euzebya tangerina]|uniref:hypothetical protein n=1 Tax=Euzebya tangerina TaxID=591198 RepID=UPI0013C32874|nr:hypothetical protein [Euzebya tangerina]
MTEPTPRRTPPPSDDLLAAWLAGDVDDATEARIDRVVATDAAVAERVDRLAETMSSLAEAVAPAPAEGFAGRLDQALTARLSETASSGSSAGPAATDGRTRRPRPVAAWGSTGGGRAGGNQSRRSRWSGVDRLVRSLAVLLVLAVTAGLGVTFLRQPLDQSQSAAPTAEEGQQAGEQAEAETSLQASGAAGAAATPTPSRQAGPGPTGEDETPFDDRGGQDFQEFDSQAADQADADDSLPDRSSSDGGDTTGSSGPGEAAGAGTASGENPSIRDEADAPPPAPAPLPAPPPTEEAEAADGPAPVNGGEAPQTPQPAPGQPDQGDPDPADPDPVAPAPGAPNTPDPATPGTPVEPPAEDSGGDAPAPILAPTSPAIIDTDAEIAGPDTARARYTGRPETAAQLGLSGEQARVRAGDHLAQLQASAPFADGTPPARCAGAAGVGDPSIIVVIETVVYQGQAALAHLVVTGSPTTDRAVVVVTDRASCAVLASVPL